jgi:CO/xanthine dehydrogenase Mo-binding subunit
VAVGKSVPALDAIAKVKGAVPYAINRALPGMLVVKVLRSVLPHAQILRLDTQAAERLPGVAAVLTGADLGQPGGPGKIYGVMKKDQPVVAMDRVRYVGEPIALVAAETGQVAESALDLIEVEYEELPVVYQSQEAMQPVAPILHEEYQNNCFRHAKLRRGDIEAGFAGADLIVEETFTSPAAQTQSLEPHVVAAQWTDGRLTIWTATQAPYRVRNSLAELFGMDPKSVRLMVPPFGGGFGGKGHIRIEPIVAALAWKVEGRPVKLVLSRDEEFVTVTKHPAVVTIKSGVKFDGTFTARQVTLYWNGGAYADASPSLVGNGMVRSVGPYRIPAVWVDSYGVYTNLPPTGAFRGAMSSQTTWAYESHMDTIAHRLGLDPLEFRLKNLLRSGEPFATGETLHDVHFVECLESAAKGLGWGIEKSQNEPVNNSKLKRGRGLAVMMKSSMGNSKSQCRMMLEAGGRLTLFTSIVEMGQGTHTALAQIAAEAVGVPLESVAVVGPDTEYTPFDSGTNSSRGTSSMGSAILNGAEVLKMKLIQAAVPLFEQSPEEISTREGYVYVLGQPDQRLSYSEVLGRNRIEAIEATGEYVTRASLDPETGQGIASQHWHQGAGACEVEVDTETGKVTVLRYHSASYAGRVINPAMADLQNNGNVIFGMGPALFEEIVFDHGQVINPNFSDYMIPSFLDTPLELKSEALETDSGEFHGIGEMTLPPVAPAIANAIYDAVGLRIRDLPLTPEKILRGLRELEK